MDIRTSYSERFRNDSRKHDASGCCRSIIKPTLCGVCWAALSDGQTRVVMQIANSRRSRHVIVTVMINHASSLILHEAINSTGMH